MEEQNHWAATPRKAGELAVPSYNYLPQELCACANHVFRVQEPEPTRVWESQSGYVQRAECLVCGKVSPRLDSTWWAQAPTEGALAESLRLLQAQPSSPAVQHRIRMLTA